MLKVTDITFHLLHQTLLSARYPARQLRVADLGIPRHGAVKVCMHGGGRGGNGSAVARASCQSIYSAVEDRK